MLYILIKNDSYDTLIYTSTDEHTHLDTVNTELLPIATKNYIQTQYLKHNIRKPNVLKYMIMEENLPQITDTQMYNLISRLKKKHLGPSQCALGEFIQWCEKRTSTPEDDDTVFVVGFDHKINQVTFQIEYFRCFLSTKRLLSYMEKNDRICADGTNKVNWQGYPAIVLGTTDHSKQFHPFGLGLCYGETSSDYEFCFKACMKLNKDYQPSVLIADNAEAITNGFIAAYGTNEFKRVNCWAHVHRKIRERSSSIANKDLREKVIKQIECLQLSPTPEIFEKASELLIEMYSQNEDAKVFMEYFNDQWLSYDPNWYEGYSLGTPSHNNALESTNRYIKDNGLDRNRLAIIQFLNQCEASVVKKWSIDRNSTVNINHKQYENEPQIELSDWTDAFKWDALRKDVVKINDKSFTRSALGGSRLTKKEVIDHFSIINALNFTNFDQMMDLVNMIWVIKINTDNWKLSTCTCPVNLKNYKCKHVIAISVRVGLTQYPPGAMALPLQQRRHRGRPAASKPALIRQPNETCANTENEHHTLQSTQPTTQTPLQSSQLQATQPTTQTPLQSSQLQATQPNIPTALQPGIQTAQRGVKRKNITDPHDSAINSKKRKTLASIQPSQSSTQQIQSIQKPRYSPFKPIIRNQPPRSAKN
jgi:hypothetical protein